MKLVAIELRTAQRRNLPSPNSRRALARPSLGARAMRHYNENAEHAATAMRCG